MARTATFIRNLSGFTGEARLYETSDQGNVIVSATNFAVGNETYIFLADEDGNVADWSELDGSLRGVWDHEAALESAGYTVN